MIVIVIIIIFLKGCYYSAVGSTGEPGERELTMVFQRFAGLRNTCEGEDRNCELQIILNAHVMNLVIFLDQWQDAGVLDIITGCSHPGGGCKSPYDIFERGSASLPVRTIAKAPANGQRLDPSNGFELLGQDDNGVLGLSLNSSRILNALRVVLRADAASTGVLRSAILRVFLFPVTLWDIRGTACSATCRPYNGTGVPAICGTTELLDEGPVDCSGEPIVTGRQQSVVRLRLPAQMDPIVGAVGHTIRVENLAAPPGSVFPTRLGVQLSNEMDLEVQFFTSHAHVAFLGPTAPVSDARLVLTSRTGYGPDPFQEATNVLYLRLQLGATIAARADRPAVLTVALPPGYTCHVDGEGGAPHFYENQALWEDYVLMRQVDAFYDNNITTLFLLDRNRDDHPDFPRGTFSTRTGDGTWDESLGRRNCTFVLGVDQVLHHRQVAFVRVVVENPSRPLQRADPENVWSIRLQSCGSIGSLDAQYSTGFNNFTQPPQVGPLDGDLWASNAAVLAALRNPVVQPTSFAANAMHFLRIFFGTVQDAGFAGEVVVDAPPSFAFGERCIVGDIEAKYYDTVDVEDSVRPLLDKASCIGVPSPDAKGGVGTNRARIRVLGRMQGRRTYALQIQVRNPLELVSPELGWYIWTADADGFIVDGSPAHVPLAPGHAESWRMFAQSWPAPPAISVVGGGLRPYRVFRALDVLVVQGLVLPGAGEAATSLRVYGPPSIHFEDPSATGFLLSAPGSTRELPFVARLEASGELLWRVLPLRRGEVYGFQAQMRVAEMLTRTSIHAFYLELGYAAEALGERFGALVADAPGLQTVIVQPVDYTTSAAGYRRNVLIFRIRTSSDIPTGKDAALIIRGGEGLRGSSLICMAVHVDDVSSPLPLDVDCTVYIYIYIYLCVYIHT